jgi:hypothetical protein
MFILPVTWRLCTSLQPALTFKFSEFCAKNVYMCFNLRTVFSLRYDLDSKCVNRQIYNVVCNVYEVRRVVIVFRVAGRRLGCVPVQLIHFTYSQNLSNIRFNIVLAPMYYPVQNRRERVRAPVKTFFRAPPPPPGKDGPTT